MSQDYNVPCLGSLPLSMAIRERADGGRPTVVSEPQSDAGRIYRQIADKLAAKIATLPKDLSEKFGVISVKRT
jgi:ATP-binding protein involved in chromosome partitioning